MTDDLFTLYVLSTAMLTWLIFGTCFAYECYHLAPNWRWKAAIIVMCGPVVWSISLWRGWLVLRRRIMTHFGVEKCGCCHH